MVNKKISAYQKLKEENLSLKRELFILATDPESTKAIEIKMKWYMQSDLEDICGLETQ